MTNPDDPNGPQLSLQDWVERNHNRSTVLASDDGMAGLLGQSENGSYGSLNGDGRIYSSGDQFRTAYGITGFDSETGTIITNPDLNYTGPSVPDDETSLRQRFQNFGSDESGYLDLDRAAEFANQMVDNLRDFANEHPDFMRAVGIVGGVGAVLGEFGEFIGNETNRDTLRESFETGDFSEFLSEFGGTALIGVAYGAAAIAGIAAVSAIPVIGVPLAAGIAASMVAYGTYEAAIGLWELANDEDLINAAVEYYNTHTIGEMAFDLGSGIYDATAEGLSNLYDAFASYIISPLVIDLDGDGVELVSLADSTAYFDLNLDGFAELTGWVSPDDALLALDVDGDGIIDDNSELLGDQTGQANGFLALAQHDSNGDGAIDANDAVFSDLIVWQDLDGDGFSDAGEMMSLSDAGITSIDLGYSTISETNADHEVRERSTVTFTDGSTTTIDDVYFENDTRSSVALLPDGFQYHEDAFRLPVLFGYGQIASTWVTLSSDAILRQDAIDLVTMIEAGNITGFLQAFEDFALAWAGVDGVDPTSRGQYIDARHLEFLERAYGTGYDQYQGQGSTVQSDPLHLAAPPLEEQYEQLIQRLAGRFLAQSASSSALLNATSATEYETLLESHFLSSMTELLTVYSPSSRSLEGEIDTLFADLAAAVEAGTLGLDDAAAVLHPIQIDLEPDLTVYQAEIAALAASLGTDAAANLSAVVQAYSGEEYIAGGEGADTLDNSTSGFFYGAEGDDTITGSEHADTFFYMSGDGSDVITDFANNGATPPHDRLVFGDLDVSEVSFQRLANDDLLITMPDGATITITDHFTNAQTYNIAEVVFADGTVLDAQGIRDKSVADQKASGYVLGSTKMETYYHAQGDGSYTIEDEFGLSSVNDRLVFTDVNPGDVSFSRGAGDDLLITLPNGEVVTIRHHFKWGGDFDMELIEFADGTILGADAIRNRTVADMVSSGLVVGSMYAETYVHTSGDGSYTIFDNGTVSSINDRLVFSDLNADQLIFSHGAGNDLVITTDTGETITITNHFAGNGNYDIEEFEFADGSVVTSVAVTPGVLVSGSSGGDVIDGSYADSNGDAIDSSGQLLAGFGGNDRIYDGAGDDIVLGGDGNDWFYAGAGADSYDGGAGNDQVWYTTVTSGLTIDMTDPTNSTGIAAGDTFANIGSLRGSDFDDVIHLADGVYGYGGDGNDTLHDGGAREALNGGNGSDVFVMGAGDGQMDWINDFTRGEDLIDISAWGVTDFSQVTVAIVATSNPDLVHVELSFGGESLRIFNYDAADAANIYASDFILATAPASVPDLYGTDAGETIDSSYVDANGTALSQFGQTIYAGDGNDNIRDGAGDDTVYGEGGRDTFYAGDGADHYDGGADKDTVNYRQIGQGLVIDMINAANSTGVAAGDTFTDIEKLQGTNHDDVIYLAAGVTGEGWGGDDIIHDSTGAESMNGGVGADTFVFMAGDGARDQITGFEEGIDQIDISAWGATGFADLKITISPLSNGTQAHVDISYNGEELRLHRMDLADASNIDAGEFIFV